jgi:hypothetical protein
MRTFPRSRFSEISGNVAMASVLQVKMTHNKQILEVRVFHQYIIWIITKVVL